MDVFGLHLREPDASGSFFLQNSVINFSSNTAVEANEPTGGSGEFDTWEKLKIELQMEGTTNDKNPIYLPRQHLPLNHGTVRASAHGRAGGHGRTILY